MSATKVAFLLVTFALAHGADQKKLMRRHAPKTMVFMPNGQLNTEQDSSRVDSLSEVSDGVGAKEYGEQVEEVKSQQETPSLIDASSEAPSGSCIGCLLDGQCRDMSIPRRCEKLKGTWCVKDRFDYSTVVAKDAFYPNTVPNFNGCMFTYDDHWIQVSERDVLNLRGKKINLPDGSCNPDGIKGYDAMMYVRTGDPTDKPDNNEWCKSTCERGSRKQNCRDMRPPCWMHYEEAIRPLEKRRYEEDIATRNKYFKTEWAKKKKDFFNNFDMIPVWNQFSHMGEDCSSNYRQGRCPKGWRECRGMCYSTVTRNSYGPYKHDMEDDFCELRCMTCQGARMALINPADLTMLSFVSRIFTDLDAQNDKEESKDYQEKGIWFRTRRFETEVQPTEFGQPWMRYIIQSFDAEDKPLPKEVLDILGPTQTYQRWMPLERKFDYNKLEGNLLCVQHIGKAEAKTNDGPDSCSGSSEQIRWESDFTYPCPGC